MKKNTGKKIENRENPPLKKVIIALFIICVMAGLLRVPMITTGLPYLFHPDEYALCNSAFENVKYDRLDPHFYIYPYYAVYAYTLADYLVFKSGVLHKEKKDLEPRDFYMTDRLLSFSLSIACVVLAFLLASSAAGETAGIIAAIFFALSYGLIESSCQIKPESGMLALTLAALIFILKSSRSPSFRNFFWAIFLSACAFFFKYNSATVFFPLAVVLTLNFRSKKKEIARAAGLALFIVALSHLPVLKSLPEAYATFTADLFNRTHTAGAPFPNFFFISYLFSKGMGFIPALLGFTALIFLTVRKPAENIFLLSFVWINFIFLFFIKMSFQQYAWMPSAALYILAAVFIREISGKRNALFIAAAVIAALSNFPAVFPLIKEHLSIDPRIAARQWVEKNIPEDAPFIYSIYGPPFCDYDPALDGNASLVDPIRDAGYSFNPLVSVRLYGYKYYALSSFAGKPNDLVPADFGLPLAVFSSAYEDRPSITIYENNSFYKMDFTPVSLVNLVEEGAWNFTSYSGKKLMTKKYKEAVKLSFFDSEKKDARHYFIQHSGLTAVLSCKFYPKKQEFLRIWMDWSPEAMLDLCFASPRGLIPALEGKRGPGRLHEYTLPLPFDKINAIYFTLDVPHNNRETYREYSLIISKAEIVSNPPF